MTPLRTAALAVSVTLALAGCATEAGREAGGSASPAPSSAPTATRSAKPSPKKPRVLPSATALPTDLADGKHYAYLKALAPKLHVVNVDVAQFLTGEAAEQAAQEDGEEAFDYYIRNQNPKLRDLKIAENVHVVTNTLTASESGSSSKDVVITLAKLASFLQQGQAQQRLFWFRLKNGFVVEIHEQYLP